MNNDELARALCEISRKYPISGLTVTEALTFINEERNLGKKHFICPQCHGSRKLSNPDYENEKYNGSWSLPSEYISCELCKGRGIVYKEYKPKMVQVGWE